MQRPYVRLALLLLAATPAAFSLWVIHHFGTDFHGGDEWDPEMAGVYIKAFNHQLTFGDLVSFHNEHRLVVPRLLYMLLNVFTQWNNRAELFFGWTLFVATSLGVLWLMHRDDGEKSRLPRPGIAARWFVCNMLLFDPAQYENWLSGWGMANALPGAMTLAAIGLAQGAGRSWIKFSSCLLLAVGATFSNGCGFVAWVVAGIVLAWSDSLSELRAKLAKLIVWAAALLLCAGLYFRHYQPPQHVNPYVPAFSKELGFIAIFSGNPFFFSKDTWQQIDCEPIGEIVLLLLAVCVVYFLHWWWSGRREQCGRAITWLAVGGFGLGAAILGAMSRSGYGPEQGVISRYATFAVFMPLALVNLAPMICDDLRRRWATEDSAPAPIWNLCPVILSTAMVVSILVGLPRVMDSIRTIQGGCLAGKGELLLLNVLPGNPYLGPAVHSNVTELKDEANAMNTMGYLHPPLLTSRDAGLIQDAAKDSSQLQGRLETGTPDGPGAIILNGWAVFPDRLRCADLVFLTYQDPEDRPIIFTIAVMGLDRSDIAIGRLDRDRRYQMCGWKALVSTSNMPPFFTTTVIRAWALDTDTGKATPLEGSLTLRP